MKDSLVDQCLNRLSDPLQLSDHGFRGATYPVIHTLAPKLCHISEKAPSSTYGQTIAPRAWRPDYYRILQCHGIPVIEVRHVIETQLRYNGAGLDAPVGHYRKACGAGTATYVRGWLPGEEASQHRDEWNNPGHDAFPEGCMEILDESHDALVVSFQPLLHSRPLLQIGPEDIELPVDMVEVRVIQLEKMGYVSVDVSMVRIRHPRHEVSFVASGPDIPDVSERLLIGSRSPVMVGHFLPPVYRDKD